MQTILLFLIQLFKFLTIFNLPSRQIKRVVRIYDAMHNIVEKTTVERCLIIKVHNSGGWVRPDTPLYITILYEDYSRPLQGIKSEYQKMEVDEDYLRMLRDLAKDKVLYIDTEKLKDGLLKNQYMRDKIKYSEVHFLGQNRRNVYFCSMATTKATNFDTYTDKAVIQIGVNEIKNSIR